MDVERIQKINNLALNLMKQGLVSDREQAIAQAEQIYSQQDTGGYSEMKELMTEPKVEEKPVVETAPQQELTQDEIRNILHQNTLFVIKKFKEFQEKINSLQKEVGDIRSKVYYNSIPSAGEFLTRETVKAPEPVVEPVMTPEPTQEQPVVAEVKAESSGNVHPRSGNYNEDDVSIEKVFYMGR
jgi:polyhydroxyalkanoate synthesis regulator phasin